VEAAVVVEAVAVAAVVVVVERALRRQVAAR
jgi:hypothetical protein